MAHRRRPMRPLGTDSFISVSQFFLKGLSANFGTRILLLYIYICRRRPIDSAVRHVTIVVQVYDNGVQ